MRTFFHCKATGAEPQELLDPAQHVSEPWGGAEHGPCDKCEGSGVALYECRSCLERGAEDGCPACGGRVRFEECCPACEGSGTITRTARHGVAVFPTREGLYRYMVERGAEIEGREIVELEGEPSQERDLDADAGALLVHPTRIVEVCPVDREIVAAIEKRLTIEGVRPGGGS